MTEAIATITVTPEHLALIKNTIAKDATPAELELFLYDNKRRGVHPLDRMIHFTKRKGRYTPITSIDFMRAQAAETGEMAGSDDPVFETDAEERVLAAKVTVYRLTQGQRYAYGATARWGEYYPGEGEQGFMWRKMPHTMLGKCAEALALRKAFPKQLQGLYAREEMAQAGPEDRSGEGSDERAAIKADHEEREYKKAMARSRKNHVAAPTEEEQAAEAEADRNISAETAFPHEHEAEERRALHLEAVRLGKILKMTGPEGIKLLQHYGGQGATPSNLDLAKFKELVEFLRAQVKKVEEIQQGSAA